MCHLFDRENCTVSTVKGYRTAICTTIRTATGRDLTGDHILHDLIEAFSIERPRDQHPLPTFDLALVLRRLLREPFEPMATAQVKFLAWKTLFLVTLASGKRRSEIHAMTDCVHWGLKGEEVYLRPSPNFISKTETARNPAGAFTECRIPALTGYVGRHERDRLLCPVRALRYYLKATEAQRHGIQYPRPLFLSVYPNRKKALSPQTIASWVRQLVKFCTDTSNEQERALSPHFKPHHIRRVSSSWAAYGTHSLEQVLRAGQWKGHNTFLSFYLTDMTLMADDLYSLGPIVAASSVVTPPARSADDRTPHPRR